jgi:hypothetical protein
VIDTLAVASLCGVPVQRIVEGDAIERELWGRVTKRAGELHVQLMRNQAVYIANAVGDLFRRR